MSNKHWDNLRHLIIVACHAVYVAEDFSEPLSDSSWFLQDFQKGEPPFYVEHIRRGIELADDDKEALLVFSGGQTRYEAGPRSEAQSYWMIADHFEWWFRTNVKLRATTEEFARDSFENLLFSICRFEECVGKYPEKIIVVSWAFKKERFDMHRKAIRFPSSRFTFEGVNNPVDLTAAEDGERKAIEDFKQDPYGTRENRGDERDENGRLIKFLGDKRRERNPFNRQHSYLTSCSELKGLLCHSGPEIYKERLPWD